jgi:RNA polymerase sigma-70 factor (ECF subfamily)
VDVGALFRAESGRATAGLARRLGDLDRAEDAVADAFLLALERWPRDGVPRDPAAWITVAARSRAIDRLRRDRNGAQKHALLARLEDPRDDGASESIGDEDRDVFGDDRLELLFACIHPSLDRNAQVALTLRTLGGLTTDEIADAFFVERTTMQQRLVRAKNKIRAAGVPFRVPPPESLGERLDAVAAVIYLIFTTGYAPPRGLSAVRTSLCESAIAICGVVVRLLPDRAEPHALDALMRFHHARRNTRSDADGNVVLLADQDRTAWARDEIDRASSSLKRALARPACSLTYEAYIAAAHAHAPSFEETDWDAIVHAYDALLLVHDTPVARCNRAVALAMRGDIAQAVAELAALGGEPAMKHNRYYHVAVADVAVRAGNGAEARHAYESAIACADTRDRRVISRRLDALANV